LARGYLGRDIYDDEWKAVRRGWYVGGAEFKERTLALVEEPLRQGRSGSYSGEAKRAHSEAEAERWLARGLARAGTGRKSIGRGLEQVYESNSGKVET
jgi:hypothetical protein